MHVHLYINGFLLITEIEGAWDKKLVRGMSEVQGSDSQHAGIGH